MDWLCYNLIILIKKCKISHKNLDKAVVFLRNQVFCLKFWKLWQASTTLQFNIFCCNFAHVYYLLITAWRVSKYGVISVVRIWTLFTQWMSTKECARFFFILFRCLHSRFLHFFNNSRPKQNKKNPELSFSDIIK